MLRASKKRKQYPHGNLLNAMNAVRSRQLGLSAASREYSVPRMTLSDHLRKNLAVRPGPVRMLTVEEEDSLCSYMKYMAGQGFPLTRSMSRMFITSIIKKANRPCLFNLDKGPSDKWFRAFLVRHPDLQERAPQRQERCRTRMANINVVNNYFDLLTTTVNKLKLNDKPGQVFNVDETGFSGKEMTRQKVVSSKGSHSYQQQVFVNDHITATMCVSADGRVLPTAVTFAKSFPHKNYHEGVSTKWLYTFSDSGYVDGDIFFQWFSKVFLPNCGPERPVLLIMDNHDSHIRLDLIDLARQNDIELLGLPPHTTHILQPLDVSIFGPLKAKFASLASKLGFANTNLTIGKARFPLLLSHAIDSTCSPANVKSSFRKTGIFPLDPKAIDKTQLTPPSFTNDTNHVAQNGKENVDKVVSCEACGNFLVNPLVAAGLVPPALADILVPPKVPAPKKRRNVVNVARMLTGDELVESLKERVRLESEKSVEVQRRKEERERKREERERNEENRKLKAAERKRLREEKQRLRAEAITLKKRKREAEKQRMDEVKQKRAKRKRCPTKRAAEAYVESESESDHETVCGVCKQRDPEEDVGGFDIDWVSCDGCGGWCHDVCVRVLSESFLCKNCSIEE